MKLAIIGASAGQLPLCKKTKEIGVKTICFAWEKDAVCKPYVDKFYPISVLEKDEILEICKKEDIDGVVSNASELLVEIAAYLSEELNLQGNSYDIIRCIKDKSYSRELSQSIPELNTVRFKIYKSGEFPNFYPCIVKPTIGASKKGVHFVNNKNDFISAISSIEKTTNSDILIEEYIEGVEVSVESISNNGKHYVLQITDKVNSGPPNFVELEHHQPSSLNDIATRKINTVIQELLGKVNFKNGASHIELKITPENDVFLIEINPRGGGDEISNQLVYLSTGYDYLKGMIEVALDKFKEPILENKCYSGIYYLCKQTEYLQSFFEESESKPWLIQKVITDKQLKVATGNYDRNGFFIYQSNKKIQQKDITK